MKILKKIFVIVGPTASGKSDFAIKIAQIFEGVIVNGDSVQLYKDIPILSAQPTADMLSKCPHKLYSILEANETASVGSYQLNAIKTINEIHEEGKIPILVGGTGLYIKSIIEGLANIPDIDSNVRNKTRELFAHIGNEAFYKILMERDPVIANKLNMGDSHRLLRAMEVIEATGKSLSYWHDLPVDKPFYDAEISSLLLIPERSMLYQKCNLRFEKMIELGAIEEVENLLKKDYATHITKAIGVNQIIEYLKGNRNLNDIIEEAQILTRQYAKRQYTWFNRQLLNSYKIHYENINELYEEDGMKDIIDFLKR